MRILFEGVELPPDDPLYYDCLAVAPELKDDEEDENKVFYNKNEGTEYTWIGCTLKGPLPMLGSVEEFDVKRVGAFAIGYELKNVLREDPVEVVFNAHRGARTDRIDAVGVPVYADCPVEFLSVSVTFEHLIPDRKPTAQFYLLRRTRVETQPLHLVGGLDIIESDDGTHTFSFQNLRYPRPGFGFCIAWGSLSKTAEC